MRRAMGMVALMVLAAGAPVLGQGMMGPGMTGPGMTGPGMMGPGWMSPGGAPPGPPISMDRAAELARQYVANFRNPDLVLHEVREFSNHFYVVVVEKSTGIGAMELLVDRGGRWIHPEPGPNMMWNTRYGHMAGGMMGHMMGGGMMDPGAMGPGMMDPHHGAPGAPGPGMMAPGTTAPGMMGPGMMTPGAPGSRPAPPAAAMRVTAEQARQIAIRYLAGVLPGSRPTDVYTFYGYYTLHVAKDGKLVGMLSVNGYTGRVWYHAWHGDFIGMKGLR